MLTKKNTQLLLLKRWIELKEIIHSLSDFFADLVDANSESWLNVSLHIFLPVVTEKARSFENGVHFCPTLRVTSTLLLGKENVLKIKERKKHTGTQAQIEGRQDEKERNGGCGGEEKDF